MSAAKILTVNELATAFGVTIQTTWVWRNGSPTKEPLPFEVDDPKAAKPRVHFKASVVKAWAKKHNLEFTMPEDATGRHAKPGPKKRVKH